MKEISGIYFIGIILMVTLCSAQNSTRVVITFYNSRVASAVEWVPFGEIVKQYGRRLVVDLGKDVDLDGDESWITDNFVNDVESVELDYVINYKQIDLVYSDSLLVSNESSGTTEDLTYLDVGVKSEYSSGEQQPSPLWNLIDSEPYSIHVEGVWQQTNSTPDVVVAVLDSGMATLAYSAFLNVASGYDFISDINMALDGDLRDPDPTDPGDNGPGCPYPSWHGTRVASLVAANHDPAYGQGVKGVAQNSTLLPVRVLGLCRTGYASDVADAIVWSAGGQINGVPPPLTPARIISMSFAGVGKCPSFLQSAIYQANNLGAILLAASGNEGINTTNYFPANCNGVLAVAASTREGKLAAYSNYGPNVAFAAPGGDQDNSIMTLAMDEFTYALELDYGMGTSFAVPQASGVAALGLSLGWNVNDLRKTLISIVKGFNISCSFCGGGILQANMILELKPSNVTYYPFNQTDALNGTNILVSASSGYTCGVNNILNSNYAYGSSGTPLYMCPGGQYICKYLIDYNSGHSGLVGINGYCCYMNGNSGAQSYLSGTSMLGAYDTYYDTYSTDQFADGGGHASIGISWNVNTATFGFDGASSVTISTGGASGNTYTNNCPSGYFVTGFQGTAGSYYTAVYPACNQICVACPANTYVSSGLGTICTPCTQCKPGYYVTGGGLGSDYTCGIIPNGYFGPGGYSIAYIQCSPGNYCPAGSGTQTACPPGTYCSVSGCASCVDCGAGYSCANSGSTAQTQCAAGYFSPATRQTTCSTCGIGTYSTGTSMTVCISCPAGTYGVGSAKTSLASSCSNCLAGTYSAATGAISVATCSQCTSGTYSADGSSSCPLSCLAGTYGQGNGITTCGICAPGTSSTASAASSISTCLGCALGTFSNVAGLATATCGSPCPAGTYGIATGQTTQALACGSCAAGTYNPTPGANSVTLCASCVAGKFSNVTGATISSTCSSCIAGTYTIVTGKTVCDICAAGMFSATTSQSVSVCTSCAAGSYSTGASSICTLCLLGTYSTKIGANSSLACSVCPLGSYCQSNGLNVSTLCPTGSYADVIGLSACKSCGSGNYTPTATSCISCNAGTYSLNNSGTCYGCGKGTVSLNGSSTCSSCAAGSYAPNVNMSSCTLCSPGSYSNTSGASSCPSCLNGSTYSVGYGSTACSTCICDTCIVGTSSTCDFFSQFFSCNVTFNSQCIFCASLPQTNVDNAQFLNLWGSGCTWNCLSGFYPKNSQCPACSTPTCNTGYYLKSCDQYNSDATCLNCTGIPN